MTDHNPAETLTNAAKLLRERAAVATAGPWVASTVRSPRATVTSGIYSHAHPAGSTASEVAASGRKGRGCGGVTNPDNAAWIALMHPGVGLALAELLETAATYYTPGVHHPTHVTRAYQLARVLLGEGGEK